MPKRHAFDRVRDAAWLGKIELAGLAMRDGAVCARPRADVAENHECRRPVMPALADVRTARLFADGMELELLHHAFQAEVILGPRCTHLEPRRLWLTRANELNRRFDHLCLV